jgi:gliding motility-associated-like protein
MMNTMGTKGNRCVRPLETNIIKTNRLSRKYLIRNIILVILLQAATLSIVAQNSASSFDFTENRGQWEQAVRFKSELSAGAFFLQKNGFTVIQHHTGDLEKFFNRHHVVEDGLVHRPDRDPATGAPAPTPSSTSTIRSHAYRVSFIGADENSAVVPEKQIETNASYFIDDDPSKWAANVPVYGAVVYKNIYPNIDIRYYSNYQQLKYDIIVHPGGDVSQIAMKYEGVDKLSIKNNELIVKTSVGDIKELYPYSYTFDMTTGKKEVNCSYQLADKNTVRFKIGNYSKTSTLVIDPTLVFCSFTGSAADQYGYTATPGPDGSLYSGGIVFGNGFKTTTGAYQTSFQGGTPLGGQVGIDMGIFKFTPNGKRAYATYLGGDGNDYPQSLICDPQGNLIILGKTFSSKFPGTQKGVGGGSDITVTKLNAAGSGLIGSLRIGGSGNDGLNIKDQIGAGVPAGTTFRFYGDDSRCEVILDKAGNIYVAAQTQSSGDANGIPVSTNAFQKSSGGGQDGAVIKINPSCTDIIWCSYLGGSGTDAAFVLELNPINNELYVAGATTSNNLTTKGGVYQGTNQGGVADGFVARISNDGTNLINLTYMGTPLFDAVYGIKFDKAGNPYIMGVTEGNWPVINAPYSVANSKQFVSKLRPDLSGFIYSTVFGNGSQQPNISPVAFLVDRCENVYISGWGGWLTPSQDPYNMGGILNMPLTNDAIKKTTDNRDFYFIVIKRDASQLLYGSYFGQSGGEGEHVDGGTSRYDQQGVIYQAVCANCFQGREYPITASFPTTPGVWAEFNGSSSCNLAAIKIAFNFAGVAAGPKSFFNGKVDTLGCAPFTVILRDTVRNAKSYEWDFDGDGITDKTGTNFEESYTFANVGNYRVRLIAIDPSTCNVRDTAYITIKVRNDPVDLNFTAVKDGPCTSLSFLFTNTSTPPPGKPFKNNSFAWQIGSSYIGPMDNSPVKYDFPSPGTYPVSLIILDTNYCNSGDSKDIKLGVVANVVAKIETPNMGCAPYDAEFTNASLGGHDFFWDFGDGTTSTEMSPVHRYDNIGTYVIKLLVLDSNTCNKRDSTTFTLSVNPKPTAAFSAAPVPPQVNTPTTFTNQSTGAIRYKWVFGDGDTAITNNKDDVKHQYNHTGTFTAVHIAFNQFNCSDTARITVETLIDPLLDVPNAFTPGRGGRSSIIKVVGFGIDNMTWRIYNRWGQKVFETSNRNDGWDGTYKGVLQPMDVYTYTLDVIYSDGKTTRRTGDITLIR